MTFDYSANEHVQNAGKKTVMPADVFQALDDTEFSFLRAPLEAEFASTSFSPLPFLLTYTLTLKSCWARRECFLKPILFILFSPPFLTLAVERGRVHFDVGLS